MKQDSISPTEKQWVKWLVRIAGIEIVCLVAFAIYQIWLAPRNAIVVKDCPWYGMARAWIDENRNGIWDAGEEPLRDVEFAIDDVGRGAHAAGGGITDWKGEAHLVAPQADCDSPNLEILASVPAGYRLTTSPSLMADNSRKDLVFEFGFGYLPGARPPTPGVPNPICTIYKLAEPHVSELTDLAVSPNGTVWVAGSSIYQLAPESSEWLDASQLHVPAGRSGRSITIENDKSIWFASGGGALHFDGTKWWSYSTPHGMLDNYVNQVAIDNRLVWFATEDNGLFMLDRMTNLWRTFTTRDGLLSDHVTAVGTSPDGSVWVSTREGTSRAIWPSRPAGDPVWQNDTHGSASATHIEARPDNKVWFGGHGWPVYFDLGSNTWRYLDFAPQGVSIESVGAFAFGQDSSLWLGSASKNKIYHVLNGWPDIADSWRTYDSSNALPPEIDLDGKIEAIAVAPYNTVWIATPVHATRCVVPD